MEENILEQGLSSNSNQSKLTNQDLSYLKSAATWAKFLAVLGFIFSALIILGGFSIAFLFSSFPLKNSGDIRLPVMMGPALGIIYAFIGIFYFVISLALNRFSNYTDRVWRSNASTDLTSAFLNLRNFFRFSGWFVIGVIILYFAVFIAFGAFAASGFLGR